FLSFTTCILVRGFLINSQIFLTKLAKFFLATTLFIFVVFPFCIIFAAFPLLYCLLLTLYRIVNVMLLYFFAHRKLWCVKYLQVRLMLINCQFGCLLNAPIN